jgi:transposase
MVKLVVGVDVSKKQLDVGFWEQGDGSFLGTYDNNTKGFKALARDVTAKAGELDCKEVHLIIEPTGGYEHRLACFGYDKGWQVSLPNPRQLRKWAEGMGYRAKTDRQDAIMLAQYGYLAHKLALWRPSPEKIAKLQALIDRRVDLKDMIQKEENRRDAFRARNRYQGGIKASLDQTIARLEQSLEEINAAIQEHIDQDPDLKEQIKLLRGVPGVGQKSAPMLLAFFHRFYCLTEGKGSSKAITAYVGLDPQPCESGRTVRGRSSISKQGNSVIRAQLYMCALGGTGAKHTPLTCFYKRLLAAGKKKILAMVASARKVLVWAWAVFKSQQPFDPKKAYARSN